jgi:hypothetical protein
MGVAVGREEKDQKRDEGTGAGRIPSRRKRRKGQQIFRAGSGMLVPNSACDLTSPHTIEYSVCLRT